MGRIKVLGLFAFLGFLAGIATNTIYKKVFPIISPEILQAEWILSGLAGSLLTTFTVILWSYLSKPLEAHLHLVSIFTGILGIIFTLNNFMLPGLTFDMISVFSAIIAIFRRF